MKKVIGRIVVDVPDFNNAYVSKRKIKEMIEAEIERLQELLEQL